MPSTGPAMRPAPHRPCPPSPSWSHVQFYGGKEVLMHASFGLPSVLAEDTSEGEKWKKRAIQVRFEIPYFTVSGIQVRYLKVIEKSGYQALPWVRYITQVRVGGCEG